MLPRKIYWILSLNIITIEEWKKDDLIILFGCLKYMKIYLYYPYVMFYLMEVFMLFDNR
jgi:hypothetical protein